MQDLGRGTRRHASAQRVFDEHLDKGSSRHVFMMDGRQPVGVMKSDILTDGAVHIHGVVTHPGTKGVGGALIEEAVNMSVRNGGSGMVHLQYLDADSRDAYRSLGFRFSGGSAVNMSLSPASHPAIWEKVDGGYQLKKPAPRRVSA